MRRNEVINALTKKNGYKSYLEIGVDNPNNCFGIIDIEHKIGVDPNKGGTHKMTSDHFFSINKIMFDIIFIDGLHIDSQVLKDLDNSLKCLNRGGAIVVHDLDPKSELEQRVPRETGVWTGNAWRAWAEYRATKKDLSMFTIDSDHGIGVIKRGRQKLYTGPYKTYQDFVENRKNILKIKEEKCLSTPKSHGSREESLDMLSIEQ